nr:MAG: Pyocin activator protein PrtN [Bacteriophage sp.]UVY59643.1 MAG: Pyocin activator protein PrtN [Bacteriophage sp.]UWD76423.1 MAG: Pyocin activator protein PrtN [Bacteriophage sp.]
MWYNNSKWRYIMRAITIDADTGKRVYTRKEVADLVGASTQSIRLWEDAGSIPASIRDEGGYRYWYEEDLEAIKAYASLPRKAKLKK